MVPFIIMWTGENIPEGWALCDGQNGTPDLRDRFIVCAGSKYTLRQTGGSNEHILKNSEMPTHKHPISIASVGDHRHAIRRASSSTGSYKGTPQDAKTRSTPYTATFNSNSHSHSVSTLSTGNDEAHENRPPFYCTVFLKNDGAKELPVGTIAMMQGVVAPQGWRMCNGQDDTPDLRNRFIVGEGSAHARRQTGGANSVTLTEGQLPNHNHSVSNTNSVSHTHTRDVHGGIDTDYSNINGGPYANYQLGETRTIDHTHDITVGNIGGGQEHENRPPYYALMYAIKVA